MLRICCVKYLVERTDTKITRPGLEQWVFGRFGTRLGTWGRGRLFAGTWLGFGRLGREVSNCIAR